MYTYMYVHVHVVATRTCMYVHVLKILCKALNLFGRKALDKLLFGLRIYKLFSRFIVATFIKFGSHLQHAGHNIIHVALQQYVLHISYIFCLLAPLIINNETIIELCICMNYLFDKVVCLAIDTKRHLRWVHGAFACFVRHIDVASPCRRSTEETLNSDVS